jgi:hypothetical protein
MQAIADAGDAATLTSAKSYTDTTSAQTLSSAKTYADTTAAHTLDSANAYTDTKVAALSDDFNQFRGATQQQFRMVDRRIDRMGAMSSAMAYMTSSVAGLPGANRLAVGVGQQNGESALAVGYQRAIGRFGVSFGGAFSGNDKSVGAGAGVSW